ncbi:MAG: SRPBCC family protein [Candidatus Cloacimonetes bacterium]|nr:SRPBCC family protein [Candidatus Cloacimonadota bacterium]
MFLFLSSALVLACVGFLGWVLFRDRSAPVAARVERLLAASPERVWAVQSDLASWSRWNPDVRSLILHGPLQAGSAFDWNGGGMQIHSVLSEVTAPVRIAWSGQAFGIRAHHSWEFVAEGTVTRVITEEVFTGPLAWLLPGTLRSVLEKALTTGLDHLQAEVERTA